MRHGHHVGDLVGQGVDIPERDEEAVNTVAGIDSLYSRSYEGSWSHWYERAPAATVG